MKSNPDTLLVSQIIKTIYPGQKIFTYSYQLSGCFTLYPKADSSVRNSVIIYFYADCPTKA